MVGKFWRSKWFIIAIVIIILVPSIVLLAFRIDYGEKEDAVLRYFSQQAGMNETFTKLEQLTPQGTIVLCWWDYGRSVRQWSHRDVIEAYPSRDIWYSVGSSRDLFHNFEAQLFGTWGSSEKIRDLAEIFMSHEDQALQIAAKYDASYALVFTPDELQKFNWIAKIAGYNGSDYLTVEGNAYEPTALGSQITLLRLLFDETLHPNHFTKLYDNGKGKIYKINYQ
jgi:hypothetical protein